MLNCITCNKPHEWDICGYCQSIGNDHPLPDKAWNELQRREKLGIDYNSRVEQVREFARYCEATSTLRS